MEWCLDCHRHPERYVRPREAVFDMNYYAATRPARARSRLVAEYHIKKLTDCSKVGHR